MTIPPWPALRPSAPSPQRDAAARSWTAADWRVAGNVLLLMPLLVWVAASGFLGGLLVFASDTCDSSYPARICTAEGQNFVAALPVKFAAPALLVAVIACAFRRRWRFAVFALAYAIAPLGFLWGAQIAGGAP